MPFKVRFNIYEDGKKAPCFVTWDRSLAHAKYNDMIRKGMSLPRMVPEIICEDLTKPEAYVFLVYRTMQAIREYFDNRFKVSKELAEEYKRVSLALESELDKWNQRTRAFLDSHCKVMDGKTTAQYSFFIIVEEWRNVWHRYFAYKNRKDKNASIEKEMRDLCFAYEREINKYVTNAIGL